MRNATLLGVEAHQEAFDIVWGLRRRAVELAAASDAVRELTALSGGIADSTHVGLPVLIRTAELVRPPGSGGLLLDEPLPVRQTLHLELVERLEGSVLGSTASVPTARQALAALGHPSPQQLVGEVDEDLLATVLVDPDAGLGEMRRDFEIDTPASRSYDGGRQTVSLDWPGVVVTELDSAWDEDEAGATDAAIRRLARLMHFLDGILGEEGSPLHPKITLEPLHALTEFSLKLRREGIGQDGTLDRARQWVSTLASHAQSLPDDYYSLQAYLLELRLDAWTDPRADLAKRLKALESRQGVADQLPEVVITLRDIATATLKVDAAVATAKALIPSRADPDNENAWYRARIELARLVAQGGDRKGARGIATRTQRSLQAHAAAPWLEEVLEEASDLAEETRAPGVR